MGLRLSQQSRFGWRRVLTIMKALMKPAFVSLCLMVASLSPSGPVLAQSVDQCMSARVNDALELCQRIIDNGSRNSDVYWKLSSAQYQSGQVDQANQTLDDALRLYPGDTRLESLKEIISTNTSEQALIARSARLNQNSLDKGAMKISCLTKNGDVGISACKRRLELTSVDGDRIRARLSSLQEIQEANRQALAPTAPDSTPDQAVTSFEPAPESVASIEPTPEPEPFTEAEAEEQQLDPQQAIAEARREAYKSLVSDVQSRLNAFGFNAGYPDGVPGANTRRALADFYTATGASPVTSITDVTLEDLQSEKSKLERANIALRESQQALSAGDRARATEKLAEAKALSGLVKVPDAHAKALATVLASSEERADQIALGPPAAKPAVSTTGSPTAVNGQTLSNNGSGVDSPALLGDLIGQINELQGRIRRQQSDYDQQMQQLRNAL